MLLLKVSQRDISDSRKSKRQLKADISSIRRTAQFSYWTDKPNLCHSKHSSHNSEEESSDSCDSRWEEFGVHINRRIIASEASLEDDVFGDRDSLVDGKPVCNQQHEVLEHVLELSVAWDGDGAVDEGPDECPHETGNALGFLGEELEGEAHGVDVRAVVGDDGEGEDDQAEFAEVAQGRDDDCGEETSDVRRLVAFHVDVVAVVCSHGCGYCRAQHLSEEKWECETGVCPAEDGLAGTVDWLIDRVVCSVGCPASCETENTRRERESRSSL